MRYLAFYGFCVLFLLDCTYKPTDKFVNPINPPPSTIKVSVDVLDPNFKDPYQLIFVTNFTFSIDSTTNPIIFSQVYLDNSSQNYVLNGNKLNFTLDPCQIPNGTHTVKIQLKIGTSSGSLADKLGGEYYPIEKTFTVVVDHDPPKSSDPINFSMQNGYLTLQWTKPSKTNFQYRIVHYSYNLSLGGDTVITDPTINKFIDKGYVGGKVSYWIYAFNSCTFDPVLAAAVSEVNVTPTVFTVSYNNDFMETILWNQKLINDTSTTVSVFSDIWQNKVPLSQNTVDGYSFPIGCFDYPTISIQRKNFPKYKYVSPNPNSSHPSPLFYFRSWTSSKNYIYIVNSNWDIQRINSATMTKEDSVSKHFSSFQ